MNFNKMADLFVCRFNYITTGKRPYCISFLITVFIFYLNVLLDLCNFYIWKHVRFREFSKSMRNSRLFYPRVALKPTPSGFPILD